jgi:hypothetical protein
MAPTYRIERDRGSKEFLQQLAVLRGRWPLAFPTEHKDVRPLAMAAAGDADRGAMAKLSAKGGSRPQGWGVGGGGWGCRWSFGGLGRSRQRA